PSHAGGGAARAGAGGGGGGALPPRFSFFLQGGGRGGGRPARPGGAPPPHQRWPGRAPRRSTGAGGGSGTWEGHRDPRARLSPQRQGAYLLSRFSAERGAATPRGQRLAPRSALRRGRDPGPWIHS